jgi:hypothetical protein
MQQGVAKAAIWRQRFGTDGVRMKSILPMFWDTARAITINGPVRSVGVGQEETK